MDELLDTHLELALAREVCLLWFNLALTQDMPAGHAKAMALSRASQILKTRGGSLTLNQKDDAKIALSALLDELQSGARKNPFFSETDPE